MVLKGITACSVCCRQANRHSSRWDQEMPKKYERTTEDTADQDEHDDGRGAKNQRVIQWVTHAQKVALVRNDNLLFPE